MYKLIDIFKEIIKESQNIKYKIFCDMDGVIVDFEKPFQKYSDGIPAWDYKETFGETKFWELIHNEGTAFWANMEWTPDGKELWEYIKKYNPTFLTQPSRKEISKIGKEEWIEKHIPNIPRIFSFEKYKHANPNNILIDDLEYNIYKWKEAGGIGVLHTSTLDTIKQLQKLGI